MSIWEFNAALQGYVDAHTPDDDGGGGMSAADQDEIWAWMQAKEGKYPN